MVQAPPPNAGRAEKTHENRLFFVKKNYLFFSSQMFLLVMPKYWGKQIFMHGSFPELGEKQKTKEKKEGKRKKKKEEKKKKKK